MTNFQEQEAQAQMNKLLGISEEVFAKQMNSASVAGQEPGAYVFGVDPAQREMNKCLGVSPEVFAKHMARLV